MTSAPWHWHQWRQPFEC